MAHTTQTSSSLVAEQLLSAQQQVLELVARAAPLSETLSAIARFSEAAIPTMKASVLVFDPVTQCLRKGGYASLPSTFADAVDDIVRDTFEHDHTDFDGNRLKFCDTDVVHFARCVSV